MTIRRWFFVVKDDGNTKKVYLYDAAHSDLSDASKIQKSKEDLGPVTKVDTAEGKKEKIAGKYGAVHGLVIECTMGKLVLNRRLFVWNANEFCMRFKERTTALQFVEEWKAWQTETESIQETVMPPEKRIRLDDKEHDSEKWMDEIDVEIDQHRVGRMDIMISQLAPPLKRRLLRNVDPNFVKALKNNMLRDPTGTGVPPAIVFTNQVSPKEFDMSLKDAYNYEVAGGLHGFTAKKELLSEVPQNPYFKTMEADVYCQLSDEQALRLALRHNLNGHLIHKMTFRDIVEACRARLVAITPEGKPFKPTAEWRTSCKTVIIPEYVSKAYKNDMLRLSVVSDTLWELYTKCFNKFESGDLKSQSLTSKQLMTKPEVKQTQFQCLLPLEEDIQKELLSKVISKVLSLRELKSCCEREKKLAEVHKKFAHLTNCASWNEAKTRFPIHSKESKLEQFLSLDFKKSVPQAFSSYCAGAVSCTNEHGTFDTIEHCTFVEVATLHNIEFSAFKEIGGGSLFIFYMEKDITPETCERYVYTACQIDAGTIIEHCNILLYGMVEQLDMARSALKKSTDDQSVLFCCNSNTKKKDKGFAGDVSVAVIGHWSKNKGGSNSNHFNFEDSRTNAILYAMTKQCCGHSDYSIEELIHTFIQLLSFPGQTVMEFFPLYACGDLALSSIREGRKVILVAGSDQAQCVRKMLHKNNEKNDKEK